MYFFSKIDTLNKNRIDSIRAKYGHKLASHAFDSLFIWQNNMSLELYAEDDFFAVKAPEGYFFPCGNAQQKKDFILNEVIPKKKNLLYMTADDADYISENFPDVFAVEPDNNASEYIYSVKEQTELTGSSFSSIRKKIHHAQANGNYHTEAITNDNLCDARAIVLEWNSLHLTNENGHFGDVEPALLCLDNYSALDILGIIVYESDKPVAYSCGSELTKDTFDLHFSKCVFYENGLDTYLKYQMFLSISGRYEYVNREEDLGIPGLRTQKTEARPCGMNRLMKGVFAE